MQIPHRILKFSVSICTVIICMVLKSCEMESEVRLDQILLVICELNTKASRFLFFNSKSFHPQSICTSSTICKHTYSITYILLLILIINMLGSPPRLYTPWEQGPHFIFIFLIAGMVPIQYTFITQTHDTFISPYLLIPYMPLRILGHEKSLSS